MPDVVAGISPSISHPQNFRKHSKEVAISWIQTTVVRALQHMKRLNKDSRWALHRKKTNTHRGFQASMFNIDHQITAFCVLTQHRTVGWHTVPWLHTVLIFCGKELGPSRYWSHSSKTMVKGKVVPVYTMKTFRGSTVTTALGSRK